jgi:hypothetical protein
MKRQIRLRAWNSVWLALAAINGPLSPTDLTAQSRLTGRLDVTVASEHMWRGLSTNRFETNLGASAWLSLSSGYIGAGVWSLGFPIGTQEATPNRPTSSGSVPLHNEWDAWVEYGLQSGGLRLSLGLSRYFLNDYGLDAARPDRLPNTTEAYARVRLFDWEIAGTTVLTPGLNAYYDLDEVRGAYFEALATLRLPLQETRSLYLTGLLGWNVGQTFDAVEGTGYFRTRGVTLLDVSIAVPVLVSTGSVTSTLTARYRVPYRLVKTDGAPGSKPGFAVGLNLSAASPW